MTTAVPGLRPLPPATVLGLWDRCAALPAADRDVALLAVATGTDVGSDVDGWESVDLGRRDRTLLELYRATFGPRIQGLVGCGGCGALLELEIDVTALLAAPPPRAAVDDGGNGGPWTALDVAGYHVEHRAPTTADLAAVATLPPGAGVPARDVLARRLIRARRGEEPVDPAQVPAAVLEAALAAISARDPYVETTVSTRCPACGAECEALLDAGELLWDRIDRSARRLLRDVDTLARAYGWTETAILGLGERRRRAYLELVR